jgi:hypothetical protein
VKFWRGWMGAFANQGAVRSGLARRRAGHFAPLAAPAIVSAYDDRGVHFSGVEFASQRREYRPRIRWANFSMLKIRFLQALNVRFAPEATEVRIDGMCLCAKSLRSNPLRGSKSREAVAG